MNKLQIDRNNCQQLQVANKDLSAVVSNMPMSPDPTNPTKAPTRPWPASTAPAARRTRSPPRPASS